MLFTHCIKFGGLKSTETIDGKPGGACHGMCGGGGRGGGSAPGTGGRVDVDVIGENDTDRFDRCEDGGEECFAPPVVVVESFVW